MVDDETADFPEPAKSTRSFLQDFAAVGFPRGPKYNNIECTIILEYENIRIQEYLHTLYIVQKYSNDCHQQNFTSATNYQNGPSDKISGTLFHKKDKIASNVIPFGDNYNWEDFKNYLCFTNMNICKI